jgi:hypothetical protein
MSIATMSKSTHKRKHAQVWLRVGDGGDYQNFDDLDAAIEYLNELSVGKPDYWSHAGAGLHTPNYWGHDYISFYWGDGDAQLVSGLTADDQAYVEDRLTEAYL